MREAERLEKEAGAAGQEAARWQDKASGYSKQEFSLQSKLDSSLRTEEHQQERRRARDQQVAQRRAAAERADLEDRLTLAEAAVTAIRQPKAGKLRILLLGSTAAGDLRVGREQSRIRAAVERALHRDAVELDARPAATTADLLDGITRFRPHVVYFS